jgi:hypothetical protein
MDKRIAKRQGAKPAKARRAKRDNKQDDTGTANAS